MNGLIFQLSAAQVALITDMLKPYVELQASISAQYRSQLAAGAMPAKAEKVEEKKPEEKNNV